MDKEKQNSKVFLNGGSKSARLCARVYPRNERTSTTPNSNREPWPQHDVPRLFLRCTTAHKCVRSVTRRTFGGWHVATEKKRVGTSRALINSGNYFVYHEVVRLCRANRRRQETANRTSTASSRAESVWKPLALSTVQYHTRSLRVLGNFYTYIHTSA